MKYLIPEEKLFNFIYKYIDEELTEDNLCWEYDPYEYDENHVDYKDTINFYGDKYETGEQDDFTFIYVKKEYYERLKKKHNDWALDWIEKAPILDFVDKRLRNRYDNIFGEFWKSVFEKWFENNYPQFPVKTYNYMI